MSKPSVWSRLGGALTDKPTGMAELQAALTNNYTIGDDGFITAGFNGKLQSVVWACTNIVAGALARGTWRGHEPTVKALNIMRPNKYVAMRSLVEDLLLDGNAYLYRDNDAISLLRADKVMPAEGPTYTYSGTDPGLGRLDPAKVCAIHGPGFDGVRSPSVIAGAARQALDLVKEAYASQKGQLKAGLRGRNVLTIDPAMGDWPDDKLRNLARSINRQSDESRESGRIPVFPPGVDPATLGGVSPADLELVELMRWLVEDLCRSFGVPPRMVGHYSTQLRVRGVEAQAEDFVRWSLQDKAELIASSINGSWLRDSPEGVRLDVNQLALGSMTERITTAKLAVGPNTDLMTQEQALAAVGINLEDLQA